MRFLLFVVAFVIGVALIAPLDRWLLPLLREPLTEAGVDLQLGSLRFALPAGLRATDVRINAPEAGIVVDSLYVGVTRSFEADACGGHASGSFTGSTLGLSLAGVDPSHCLRVGKLSLDATLDASVTADGIDLLHGTADAQATARVNVTSTGGVFRGVLEHANSDGSDLPLGEWEFSDLVLKARLKGGDVDVEEGHARTSGVEWQLLGASLPSGQGRSALRVDFRVRQIEDSARAKALIGLMPRSSADAGGWHRFRVVGTLASPRVIAVD